MKIFFINNGNGLSVLLTLIFFVMNDLTGDYLPKFSNWYLDNGNIFNNSFTSCFFKHLL